jgi:hypothetical protein
VPFRSALLALIAATLVTVSVAITGIAIAALIAEDEPVADAVFAEQSTVEIQAQVAEDMGAVTSARVVGDITQSGVLTSIDLTQNTLGGCVGTLATSGGTARIIVNADGQYLKGDQQFWKAVVGTTKEAKRVTATVGQKWAKMPEARGGFGAFCTLNEILTALQTAGADQGSATIGREEVIGSVPALELNGAGQPPTEVWVATEAPHYIVRLVAQDSTLDFSEFNGPVEANSPPAREVVDFTKV